MKLLHPFFQTQPWLGLDLSKARKQKLFMAIDLLLFVVALDCSFWLRFDTPLSASELSEYAGSIGLFVALKHIVFRVRGMYRPLLHDDPNVDCIALAVQSVFYSSIIWGCWVYLQENDLFPKAVLIIDALLVLTLTVGMRLLIRAAIRRWQRWQHRPSQVQRLAIYGAGTAGSQLVSALAREASYRAIALFDDNPDLHGATLQGLPIHPPALLPEMWSQNQFDRVILALPSVDRASQRQILDRLKMLSIPVQTVPSLSEILSDKAAIAKFRDLDLDELLGREEVHSDRQLLSSAIAGKSILVTGAGGSIGSELCRQIARERPERLVLYELNEYALYQIDLELAETFPDVPRVACLGNIADGEHLRRVLRSYRVDTVYHAAAYKHVPLVEINPFDGVDNNVFGTLVAAQSAIDCGVENFVFISTDKAVRPTNIMGTSKRVAELIVQALAARHSTMTCFSIVRFGNVLGSSGSVVPRFRQQIAQRQPITITHREITRYFMSIPEAARLVIQAGAMAKGGEIFLLDMGEPVRIYDLALQMIHLSGLTPGRDIEIQFTGLRPGEKLYEELLIAGNNIQPTEHPQIYSAREYFWNWEILLSSLETLRRVVRLRDREQLIAELRTLVPEYQPQTFPKQNPTPLLRTVGLKSPSRMMGTRQSAEVRESRGERCRFDRRVC
ncbi:MAG: nucleoside-diphosphate sugar epimerase/dehydratase [Cyanobacteriota bacterium]|nr:nucleoside-diphosphate sugar epimerase/dehydratase [Cyanobacteriota bacterium]